MGQSNTQKGVLVFVAVLAVALLVTMLPKILADEEDAPEVDSSMGGSLVDQSYEEIPPGVAVSDPSEVGMEALRIGFTVDPTQVNSMNQSLIKARGLISDAYHAELRNNGGPAQAFTYWREHGISWVVASIEELPHDSALDSADKVYRTYRVVQTKDPKVTSYVEVVDQSTTVNVLLNKYGSKGWKVDRVW